MSRQQDRTRLKRTAAAGAALVALGGSVASADDPGEATQTVTITVTQAPRTVSVAGSPALSIVSGASGNTAEFAGSPTISYANPAGLGLAQIDASITRLTIDGEERTSPNGSDLVDLFGVSGVSLTVRTTTGDTDSEQTGFVALSALTGQLSTSAVVSGVSSGTTRTTQPITYGIVGSPDNVGVHTIDITFTITDDTVTTEDDPADDGDPL
jgi:hypothetical protein